MKKLFAAVTFLLSSFAATAQKIPYTNCERCWLPDSLGNHRVVLTFGGTGDMASVIIPWRRRDTNPEDKRIIIEDAKTHQKIGNVKVSKIDRESGTIYF